MSARSTSDRENAKHAETPGPEAEHEAGQDMRSRALNRRRAQRREGDVPEYGESGAPLDSGMRAKAEKSLGADLSGVRVFEGAQAAQANAQMGSQAFTHGQDVVLGPGVKNGANPILGHELAHTVQQQGAAPRVAQKSDRDARTSGHEVEADRAASRIMVGAPANVGRVGEARVQCFEGGEHMALGNAGFGEAEITVGKVHAPPGVFTALQGDLYGGSWDDLEKDCNEHPDKINKFKDIFQKEWAQQKQGKQVDDDGPLTLNSMGDRADYLKYASENFAHFSEKTKDSDAEFKRLEQLDPQYAKDLEGARAKYGANIAEFLRLHFDAAQRGFSLGKAGQSIDVAVAMDAGACHFLTDAFSSGHMRAPRQPVIDYYEPLFKGRGEAWVQSKIDLLPDTIDIAKTAQALGIPGAGLVPDKWDPKIPLGGIKSGAMNKARGPVDKGMKTLADYLSGFVTKTMHDADNKNGLDVHNAKGSWHATGDNHMSESPENMAMAGECVKQVSDHLHKIYQAGAASSSSKKDDKAAAGGAPDKSGGSDTIPYYPLDPILSLVPVIDATPANAALPEWRWDKADQSFRDAVIAKTEASIKDTVTGLIEEIKKELVAAITGWITAQLEKLGKAGHWVGDKVTKIAQWVVDQIPTFDPGVLEQAIIQGMLAGG